MPPRGSSSQRRDTGHDQELSGSVFHRRLALVSSLRTRAASCGGRSGCGCPPGRRKKAVVIESLSTAVSTSKARPIPSSSARLAATSSTTKATWQTYRWFDARRPRRPADDLQGAPCVVGQEVAGRICPGRCRGPRGGRRPGRRSPSGSTGLPRRWRRARSGPWRGVLGFGVRCDAGQFEHRRPLLGPDRLDREAAPLAEQFHPGQRGDLAQLGQASSGGSIGRTARIVT